MKIRELRALLARLPAHLDDAEVVAPAPDHSFEPVSAGPERVARYTRGWGWGAVFAELPVVADPDHRGEEVDALVIR